MVHPSLEARARAAEKRLGQVLGDKWRLERLLGIGGMAVVYEATHVNNLRKVAIKLLHGELAAKEDVRKRFLREGYIANKVGHPGAVGVLDDGLTDDGGVFLVMELVEGETLFARFEALGKKMDPLEVLRISDKVLDVLAAAHAQGIVHRDLKPENIFLMPDGGIKVLDFGIARLLETGTDLTTQSGMIVGTPTYMPPEQIAGKAEDIDGRTDVWAWGAVMFTLVSGQFVHVAKAHNELLLRVMMDTPRSLSAAAPEAPVPFVAVVDRALSKAKENRWPDAATMQAAVRETMASIEGDRALWPTQRRSGAPRFVSLVEASLSAPPPEPTGRRGLPILAALGALLVAALVAAGVWAGRGPAVKGASPAPSGPLLAATSGSDDAGVGVDAATGAEVVADAGDEEDPDADIEEEDDDDEDGGEASGVAATVTGGGHGAAPPTARKPSPRPDGGPRRTHGLDAEAPRRRHRVRRPPPGGTTAPAPTREPKKPWQR